MLYLCILENSILSFYRMSYVFNYSLFSDIHNTLYSIVCTIYNNCRLKYTIIFRLNPKMNNFISNIIIILLYSKYVCMCYKYSMQYYNIYIIIKFKIKIV